MTVKEGIFGVINGKIIRFIEEKGTDELSKREQTAGKIDSGFEHIAICNKRLAKKHHDADFATFPRGRVKFDIKKNRHTIYADTCITDSEIRQIKYCRKCKTKKNELPRLYHTPLQDGYKIKIATDGDGVGILRTVHKDDDSQSFEDIADYISPYVKESNGKATCRFEVLETPSSDFSVFFADKTGVIPLYETDKTIRYTILDGENRIGANLIELKCADTNILVECGNELEPTEEGMELRNKIKNKHYDACFITHYHGDHAGLLREPINCDVIYMSEAALKILKVIGGICEENIAKAVAFDRSRDYRETGNGVKVSNMFFTHDKIKVKDLYFDYYLCDHSAYGSYMFQFISEKTSLLYTGDFRSNGRKDFDKLLEELPRKADTLICEGTNAKSDKPQLSEQDLENKLVDILRNNDKPVFVLQSATNIDRIVSVYRAAVRSNRLFIMRLVQADICSELKNIPRPNGFKMCFAYPEYPLSDEQHNIYSEKYPKRLLGRDRISQMKKYILEVTSKDLRYLQKLAEGCDLKGAKLVYSAWSGYKDRGDMKEFLDGVQALGIEIVDLHASGHADNAAIEALRKRVNPDEFIQIHKPQEN